MLKQTTLPDQTFLLELTPSGLWGRYSYSLILELLSKILAREYRQVVEPFSRLEDILHRSKGGNRELNMYMELVLTNYDRFRRYYVRKGK